MVDFPPASRTRARGDYRRAQQEGGEPAENSAVVPAGPIRPNIFEEHCNDRKRYLIERLAEAIAQHIRPAIPLSIDLWDIATIAAYLKRDPAVVRERMACLPSFPKAIRLPTKTGRAQPLYRAAEVIKWTEAYRDKS